MSRPTLGPTQHSVKWVLGLFPGGRTAGELRRPSTQSKAEVKEKVLYFYPPPPGLHGLFQGEIYPLSLPFTVKVSIHEGRNSFLRSNYGLRTAVCYPVFRRIILGHRTDEKTRPLHQALCATL